MSDYKPSDFVNLGHPSCSRWGKSEVETMALAYVEALAADGDTWKKLTRKDVLRLLPGDTFGYVRSFFEDDYYQHWFDSVSEQITDSDGALGVRGFWNEYRLARATAGE